MTSKLPKYLALFSLVWVFIISCSPQHQQSTFANAGPVAQQQSNLYYLMFWIAALIFVLVQGALIFALLNFRRREKPKPGREGHIMSIGLLDCSCIKGITLTNS